MFHDFSHWCESKYDEKECDKKYDSFRNEKDNKLTVGTLKQLAKEDSPTEYSLMKFKGVSSGKKWDLSEAEFAKALKRICFNDKPVLFYVLYIKFYSISSFFK